MLSLHDLGAFYEPVIVLDRVCFDVRAGEVVAVVGRNGIGKSTLLRAIFGLVPTRGSLCVDGVEVLGSTDARVRRFGFSFLPQEQRVVRSIPVNRNIRLAGSCRTSAFRADLDRWLMHCEYGTDRPAGELWLALSRLYPILHPLLARHADQLSGGEEAVVGLVCTVVACRSLLVLDELSAGASPQTIDSLFSFLEHLVANGSYGILAAEQDSRFVVRLATRLLLLYQHDEYLPAMVLEVPSGALNEYRALDPTPEDMVGWFTERMELRPEQWGGLGGSAAGRGSVP